MTLVSVESPQENLVLFQLINRIDNEWWWTSASDDGSEGRWTWMATGRPVGFANWKRGDPVWGDQPNGGVEQNYMKISRSNNGQWFDIEQDNSIYSICEY